MTTLLRKFRSIPSRITSVAREISHVCTESKRALRDYALISRRVKNSGLSEKPSKGTVVFNAVRAGQSADLELYMAHLCGLNGMKVYVLFDDGVLEHWDSNQLHAETYASPYRAPWYIRWPCVIRKWLVFRAYRTGAMRCLDYSTIVRHCPVDYAPQESDLDHAISSTKRFYEAGDVDFEGVHKEFYRSCLRNCAVSRTVARYILQELKADLFVTSHGIYSTWGPAYREIRGSGVPTLVHHKDGTRQGSFRLVDEYVQRLSKSSDWSEFDILTPVGCREEAGKRLLEERFAVGSSDLREYYPDGAHQGEYGLELLPEEQIVFGMFPNVVWDGDIPERNIVFENVVQWCVSTIEVLRDTSHHLCIRFHPAEATRMLGTLRLQDLLEEEIPDISKIKNLTLIGSSEKVDSYNLARKNIDVGLIYDGTLCLELTCLNIPVVAATNGLFTLDGVAFKPDTLAAYQECLRNPDSLLMKFNLERETRKTKAYKYTYWLFRDSPFTFTPLISPHRVLMDYKTVKRTEPLSRDQERIMDRLRKALNADAGNNSGAFDQSI